MKIGHIVMDAPVTRSLLDEVPNGLVGRSINRIEGPLKVSGQARYSAEHAFAGLAHGVMVQAPFGKGRVVHLDDSVALAMPGVLAVIADEKLIRNTGDFGGAKAPVQGVREVAYFRQPIAVVVANSFEQARAAAQAVRVRFESSAGAFDFDQLLGSAKAPTDDLTGLFLIHTEQGDLEGAMGRAAAKVEETWTTPSHSHAAMEPHASVAVWKDGKVTVYGSYQSPAIPRDQIASSLGIEPSKVRVISRFVGGGFGGKLGVNPEAVAAAIAARHVRRPVKVVMTRQQVFDITGRRPETRQRIRLGADTDGTLTAVSHETITSQLEGEIFFEPAGVATHFLYEGENRVIDHKVVRMNKLISVAMRAPGEAAGQLALESAMDELAWKLGIDPVELRLRNEPARHPELGIPFSSRSLKECLATGAERFGWARRNRDPGAMRDGEWLVGHGMAVAARGNLLGPSKARVAIDRQGHVTVTTEMTDIGTGTYTILAQIAADLLGVPLEHVSVVLGDSNDPRSAGSGGSWGSATSGSAVYAACDTLRARLASAAKCRVEDMKLVDGRLETNGTRRPIGEFVGAGLAADGSVEAGKTLQTFSQAGYGAHFCEVRVNAVTGETRVVRWNSVFAAGRILNTKTATSQCIGGVIFGIGAALTEELVHDVRTGKVVNRDLGEYHVPSHADIPEIDVLLLDERDPASNPLQLKGIGELGISGAGAAVANAIFNATGARIRSFPITLDKLLAHLPL